MNEQTTSEEKTLPKFEHHAFYETMADMEKAAELAGYHKVETKTPGYPARIHFERPPGPCPNHGGNHIWWTQKMGFSRVGGFGSRYGYSTYSFS